jgi:threonine aldolase
MFNAQVGDDVYKQDPTVIALEARLAGMFGMEAGLFFPSGTMANQTAIKLHTQPGEQLIADKYAHVYHYEGGGVSFNSGVSCCLLDGNRGMITAEQVAGAINDPEFYHSPLTSLVCVENTTNKGGGACYDLEELKKIKAVCVANNLKFHLDGARIWNAIVAKKQHPREFGELFDTISVCLSRALRIRKILGGGMRQVGYLAAAGNFALDNNIAKLVDDHRRAREIAEVLSRQLWIGKIEPVETNILIFSVREGLSEKLLIEKLKEKNILISSLGHGKLRIVTHLDYKEVMHTYVLETLQKIIL